MLHVLVEQERNGRRATRGGQSRARLELVESDRRRGAHGERNVQALRSERLLHLRGHPLAVVADIFRCGDQLQQVERVVLCVRLGRRRRRRSRHGSGRAAIGQRQRGHLRRVGGERGHADGVRRGALGRDCCAHRAGLLADTVHGGLHA